MNSRGGINWSLIKEDGEHPGQGSLGRGPWVFFTPPSTETQTKLKKGNHLLALEPTGAYSTSKKTLVSAMMERVDENERVEGWKEQLREEKREGGVDLRRQNMVRGRAERDNSGAGLYTG